LKHLVDAHTLLWSQDDTSLLRRRESRKIKEKIFFGGREYFGQPRPFDTFDHMHIELNMHVRCALSQPGGT
jgi:hypothetical protein